MVQVAVPSRQNVGEYQVIREEIERIVGRINGSYGTSGWVPVHYYYRSLDRDELMAHYMAADVMLVTPLAQATRGRSCSRSSPVPPRS